jgi:hypothetical protein
MSNDHLKGGTDNACRIQVSSIIVLYCEKLHDQNTSAKVSRHRQNVVLRHTQKDHDLVVFFQHFAEGGFYFCRRGLSGIVQRNADRKWSQWFP